MSKETVDGLVARRPRSRGEARRQVRRDMPGIALTDGWRNQQWIRLRCAAAGIADWVGQFGGAFSDPAGHSPYRTLASDNVDGDMPSYELTVARRREFNARIDECSHWGNAGRRH
jgi:hypothetical protein